jgi:hypothetical protein
MIITDDLEELVPNKFPRVDELHLYTLPKVSRRYINGINQIRTLRMDIINSASRLCRQFPCIERLYISRVESYREITFILNNLKSHLSYVSLSWSSKNQSQRSFRLIHNFLQQYQDNFSFTYRSRHQHVSTIHLWISSNIEQVKL